MLTKKEIQPVADELLARWEKMDPSTRDPEYPAGAYDLARQYMNELLGRGYTEQQLTAWTPAEVVELYDSGSRP